MGLPHDRKAFTNLLCKMDTVNFVEVKMDSPVKGTKYFAYLLVILFSLNIVNWIGFYQGVKSSWFYATCDILTVFLIFALLIQQRKTLYEIKVDKLSILILIVFPAIGFSANDPNWIKIIFYLAYFVGVVVFLIFWKRCRDKKIENFSMKQILFLFAGFAIGFIIALPKLLLGKSTLLYEVINNPFELFYSSLVSFSFCKEEFIFRGLLWGFLQTKKINDNLIILITTIIWVSLHFNAYQSLPEIVNLLILGLVMGFLVKKMNSINISIGTHAGYSSLLIYRDLFIGKY